MILLTKLHTLEEYQNALRVLNEKTDKLEISMNLFYLFQNLDTNYEYINDDNEKRLCGELVDIYFKNPETQLVYKAYCKQGTKTTIKMD